MAERYDVTRLNKVGRTPELASYDKEVVHAIFRACPTVTLGFVDENGFPQLVPLVAGLEDTEEGLFVIMHGWGGARFVRLTRERGVPLCVNATLNDGIVLAISAFHTDINYRSAILHGFSDPLEDDLESNRKLAKIIVDGVMTGRWAGTRQPTDAELKATGFVRMRVETGSAKVRSGGPKDDKEDKKLLKNVWTGIVPLVSRYSQPIPDSVNTIPVPKYVQDAIAHPL